MNKKVILLGIPHLDWALLKFILREKTFRGFRKLFKNCWYGEIVPQHDPPSTPVEFTTIVTGVKKEYHKIGYGKYSDGEYVNRGRIYSRLDIKAKPIWELALEHGKSVGIYNWLLTWPAKRINGFMITGRTSQNEENKAYPGWLMAELKKLSHPDFFDGHFAFSLIKEFDVDFFLGMEERAHGPSHEYWRAFEEGKKFAIKKLINCFKEVDCFLSLCLEKLKDWVILIVSESGMKKREYPIYTLGNEIIDFFRKLNIGVQLYATDIYPPTLPKNTPAIYLPSKRKKRKKIIKILNSVRYKESDRPFIKNIKWVDDFLSFSFNFHPSYVKYRSGNFYLTLPNGEEFRMWVIKQTGSSNNTGGVFLMNSPKLEKKNLNKVSTLDIAPTILKLLHLPVPKYMKGKVVVQ
ncbi:MAG: alkaline phosphatase family protein [Candidatus Aenigmatarchaeota archaeon]